MKVRTVLLLGNASSLDAKVARNRIYARAHYKKYPERTKERNKRWRAKNVERERERKRRWREENREKLRAYERMYYAKNQKRREWLREKCRLWRLARRLNGSQKSNSNTGTQPSPINGND